MISAVYQALGARHSSSLIVASAQMVRGLDYLGFQSELIAACTSVYRSADKPVAMADIGVWQHPPIIQDDGTTDSHAVIWTSSFSRCIDLGVCQHTGLQRETVTAQVVTLPVILPVPGGRDYLLTSARSLVTFRKPFALQWMFFPQWTPHLEPLLERHSGIIEHGGLALAHMVVDQLSAVAVTRNLHQIKTLYPRLSDLLVGNTRLPELNDSLPREPDPQ
jgi:hypothetical protein